MTKIWRILDQELYDAEANSSIREIEVIQEARLNGCGPSIFEASGKVLITGDRKGRISLWQKPKMPD